MGRSGRDTTIRTRCGAGRTDFAYLERDADADAYQGHSYTRVYVEELGTFPSASPVLRLMATLRSGEGVPCGFRATGNPGGPGHQWVKARYIDPNPAGWEVRKFTFENPWTRETIEQDRVFIPSKLRDNKFLGPEYVANLQMVGSDTLVRAWLKGDWTVFEGAYFDCWRYDQHVVEPFEVPAHWARFRSMDWGSAKPFSVGWWAIVGDDQCLSIQGASRIIPRGALLRYREWYGAASPNVGLKMTAEAEKGLAAFLAAHPQQSAMYDSWLGILRDELGQWTEGEKSHRAALALGPESDYLHNNLGYNLLMQKRPSEAAFEFKQALKLKPGSEVARNNLGMALLDAPHEALLHWQSISDPATAHSNMAALLIEQGKYAEARRELDLALGYNRANAAALSNLKLVSELDGKPAVIPIKPLRTKWGRFRSAVLKAVGG